MNRRRHREYLLKKEHEEKEATILKNKSLLKDHLELNKPLSGLLKQKGHTLLQEDLYTIDTTVVKKLTPIITTSRKPSDALKKFTRRLGHIFGANTLPRGNLTKEDLNSYIERSDYNMLIVVNENKGVPSSLSFFEFPYGLSFLFSLHNVNLKRFKVVGNAYFMAEDMLDEKEKVKECFSRMFPNAKCKRVCMLAYRNGMICFRHFCNDENEGFDLKLYEIVRGALDGGEKEWVYKPYMNTTRKKD